MVLMAKKLDEDGVYAYRVVRYEDDGAKCVLSPMVSCFDFPGGSEYNEQEKEFTIASDEMPEKIRLNYLQKGTPVTLYGLKKASHLNGKKGDARKYNEETKRYAVHLFDKTLGTVSVKMDNLHVLIDLP